MTAAHANPISRHGRRALALLAAASLLVPPSAGRAQPNVNAMSLIRDTEIEEILRVDATPIFRAAGLTPENVQIHLIGDKQINAGVAGGQQLFLNTGLIVKTKNPNELMGVIAHEAGHMAGGHLARSDAGIKGATATYLATMGLGILAALSGAGDAAAGLMYSSSYFATLQMLGYTRTQEASADQAAAKYLESAGSSGRGLVDFFEEFRYEEVFSDARKEPYFRNHPLSSERIAALASVVVTKSNYKKVDSPEAQASHDIMVAKLKAFINYPQQTFVDYPDTDKSFPARYARAIATYRDLHTDEAVRLVDALIAERPNDPYLYELKGQIFYESGRIKESEAPHRRAVELKPNAPLLRVLLGQTLVALDDKTRLPEAIDHLTRALTIDVDDPMSWRLMSQAYDRMDQPGMARLAAAEQNYSLGQILPARDFARRAQEYLPKDSPQWRRANDIVVVADAAEREARHPTRGGFSFSGGPAIGPASTTR
ncbi:M48 family metallopeptidase [soil metagenome]